MQVMTVCGPVNAEELGITLPHEHLIVDVSFRARKSENPVLQELAVKPVSPEIFGDIRRNPTISIDNLKLTDIDLAIEELNYFKQAGGQTLVDLTIKSVGGNPAALKKISQVTGINIITGCGYYSPVLPANIDELTKSELTDNILEEIEGGLDKTGIKPGVIGEIGTSWPLTPVEQKILRAAATAQKETALALMIHPFVWEKSALPILDIIEDEGADLHRVVICHLDHVINVDYHKTIADRGAYVEYDRFGVEWYSCNDPLRFFPRDFERIDGLIELIKSGFLKQILVSQDVCQKIELKKFGGHGYSHILRYVIPMMKSKGLSEQQIDTILIENPKRMLGC